ncbi:hypothetical protein ACFQZC_35055 [Streptacidiphilus monticola]
MGAALTGAAAPQLAFSAVQKKWKAHQRLPGGDLGRVARNRPQARRVFFAEIPDSAQSATRRRVRRPTRDREESGGTDRGVRHHRAGRGPGRRPHAAAADITADILAGRDVVLNGDTVVTLPAGTTTYGGVLSGQGTLTLRAASGAATLVLTRDSDFALPAGRSHQQVSTTRSHPVTTVSRPDPPAVTVERGVTLQYGTGVRPE